MSISKKRDLSSPTKPRSKPKSSPPSSHPTKHLRNLGKGQLKPKKNSGSSKTYFLGFGIGVLFLIAGIIFFISRKEHENKAEQQVTSAAVNSQNGVHKIANPLTQVAANGLSDRGRPLSEKINDPKMLKKIRIATIGGSTIFKDSSNHNVRWTTEEGDEVNSVIFSHRPNNETMATFNEAGIYTLQINPDKNLIINVVEPDDIVFAINCGGKHYKAANGIHYSADDFYLGGDIDNFEIDSIQNTGDDSIFKVARSKHKAYSFGVPNGEYLVCLQFAETFFEDPRSRVFDVYIEDALRIKDLNLLLITGSRRTAVEYIFKTTVRDRTLDMDFTSSADHPLINAIVVVKQ